MTQVTTFAERLRAAVSDTGPLAAGIDPSGRLLEQWGLTDDAAGLARFGTRCVEAFAGVLPAVKCQVAFFERHGAAGLAALEGLLAEARQAGLLVIADAKRGDVESTSAAYADAWLGDGPLAADAVTATPYVGLGALSPMVDLARRHGRCVLVVVRTSNREGRAVQESVTALGVALEDALFAEIAEANRVSPGALGAVVGATLEPSRFDLAGLGGPVLAPGVGAQGATPGDVGRRFSGLAVGAVLPSASRSLLDLGPAEAALRAGAAELRDALARALA